MAKKPSIRTQTGFLRPTSSVLLAPARAMSSHVRRIYHEKYQGQYRFAFIVFLFDAFLTGIIVTLLGINIFLWASSNSKTSGLEAEVHAPVMIASQTIPVEVVIKSTDGRIHRDVSLTWEFSPSIDVKAMSPAAGLFGSVKLGDISPLSQAHAKVRIQVHAEVGSKVPLRFRVREGLWGNTIQGGEVRQVESGALYAEPAVEAKEVFPGAAIPLRIKNTGNEETDAFILRLIRNTGSNASFGNLGTMVQMEKLAAGEEKIIGIQLDQEISNSVQLTWQLEQQGRIIFRKSGIWKSAVGIAPQVTVKKNEKNIEIQNNNNTDIKIVGMQGEFDVPQNQSRTIDPSQATIGGYVFPYIESSHGSQLVVPTLLPIPVQLPFEAEVRYYSATGDQLGIGPLPPREGELTSYWVLWRVGPVDRELNDLHVHAKLASGVERTGAFTASLGKNNSVDKNEMDWLIPRLEAGTKAEFGLEIQVKPKPEQVGKVLPLVSTSTIENVFVQNWKNPLTSLLDSDFKNKSPGIVLPRISK
ncbi:hypothetical protein IT408_00020 [Candidatus Uhrbacteria bacterium]|nr:hypothetical protein [Candidatus Uhrbacteria bacterium]